MSPKKSTALACSNSIGGKVECRTEAGLEVGAKTRLHCTIMAVASVFLAMGSIFLSTTSIFLVSASVFSS